MKAKLFNQRHSAFGVVSYLIVSFCSIVQVTAQAPDWAWARSGGGIDGEFAYSVATDPLGNVFVAGYFESASITIGSNTLTSVGSIDVFIAKYDADGNVLWAKSEGSTGPDHAVGITADAAGNCYVVGYFNGPSIILAGTTFINQGNNDLFIAKYDADGNPLWAKSAGEEYDDYAFSVASDGSDNIYMTGIFYGATITFGSTTLTNAYVGYRDIYIVKYDADGNVLWAKRGGGSWDDNAYSVSVDASGNSFVTGVFLSPTITFGLTTLTNTDQYGALTYDMFVVKYDPDGNVLWANSAVGGDNDYAYSVSAEQGSNGSCFVTGMFLSSDITFGPTTLTNPGDWTMYIVKYDADGNVLWAKNAGGTQNVAQSVIADPAGSGGCFAGGYFNSLTTTFDTLTLTNSNNNTSSDIFLVRYDGAGNALWAKGSDGDGNDQIFSVAATSTGAVYAAGNYSIPTPIVFDTTTLECVGFYDMFVAKIQDTTSLLPISAFSSSDTSLCEKFCIAFTDQSLNNPVSWLWTFEGASPTTSTDQNPSNVCYDDPGVFDVTLITTNANGISDTLTLNNFITVNPNPFAPTITQSGNTLTSSFGTTYQWYFNSDIIPGATNQSYDFTQSGLYTVEVSNENGCKSQATVDAVFTGLNELSDEFIVNILNNLSSDQLIIETSGNSTAELELVNVMGERLYQETENFNSSIESFSINIAEIPSGLYFLVVDYGAESKTFKVLKQ